MRDTLYRLTSPFLDQIPDISHQPKGRQISIGLGASLLFHVLLLLLALLYDQVRVLLAMLLALILSLLDLPPLDAPKPTPKPKLQEIEVTVLPPVAAAQVVTPEELERMKQFLDSTGLATAAASPDKPIFESDVDMRAASEKAATGDVPLPTQDGRKDRSSPGFTDQKTKLGSTAEPPAPPPAAKMANTEQPPAAAPVKKPEGEAAPPSPLKEVTVPGPDEIALSRKEAAPPIPPAPPALKFKTNPEMVMLTPSAATPKPASTYQSFEEKTKIEGSISNRGTNSVDAAGTPLGRYQKGVRAAIGSRWNHYVISPAGNVIFPPGSVRVSFSIDRRGKISKIKSTGNTSSASYAFTCEKAVRDSDLPPPPKNLFDPLPDGKLDITYTFTIYSPF